MDATVILCTYNRCQRMQRVLEDLACQRVKATIDWQVLVVDNNSTDNTKSIVEDYVGRHPHRFAYAFEGMQGKAHALNTGVRLAAGDILAFTDDDVRLDPDWLANLLLAFDNPRILGAGGRIAPTWDSKPPGWLPADVRLLRGPLVMFDLGEKSTTLFEAPFGANMAFRKEAFQKFGAFRVDLGPRPGSEIRGEDSEFSDRLLRSEEVMMYQPAALVYHGVPPERLSKKFFLKWWFDKGRSDVISDVGSGKRVTAVSTAVPGAVKWIVAWLVTVNRTRRFERRLLAWYRLGTIAELRRCARKAASQTSAFDNR